MGEEVRTNDGALTEQEMSAREERRLELQREFSYDGYLVIRKELYANLRDPAVTVRDGNITFNNACIEAFTDVVYVRLHFNEELGRLAVRKVNENDKDALRWCILKNGKRKSRKVTCPDLTDLIYTTMKWDTKYKYKILGYLIEVDGEQVFVFDFTVKRMYHERPKKGEPGYDQPLDRKGFFPDDVANTFGVPVEEHARQTEISDVDGYINVAMLTGPRRSARQRSLDPSMSAGQISFDELSVESNQTDTSRTGSNQTGEVPDVRSDLSD